MSLVCVLHVALQKCSPCAEDYGGPEAMSELETQHIINNFRNNAPIVGALDFHSYGQLILRPWGMSNESAEHDSIHSAIGSKMVELIKKVSVTTGNHVRVGDQYVIQCTPAP